MKRSIGYLIIATGFLLCLAIAFVVNRHIRRIQNQPGVLQGTALAEFTSLEPIDAHTHISQTGPAFVAMLGRLHMHVLDILYVDDTDPDRASIVQQKRDALRFVDSSPEHAQLCTTFDPFRFNNANFSKEAIDGLSRDYARGAVAVKIWKNVGMEIKKTSGQYLMVDDPSFEAIYRAVAAHGKTLVTHVADPDTAWGLQETYGFNTRYYEMKPQWDMSKKPGAPEKATILQARDHLLAMNPGLRVVGAHFASMEDHLDDLAARLDRYPNFAVDIAGRVKRLVFQPRDKVRAFIIKYQDRILYGTDLSYTSKTPDQTAAQSWEKQYALDWRYFATDDIFEYQGHKVEGLKIPLPVLEKLYHANAVHWIPGIEGNQH
jgi:predicted TIM-barrel fold metal-dependent hydrolase